MAFNPATLTTEIIDKFDTERIDLGFDPLTTHQKDGMIPLIESIATAVLAHIAANGVVSVTVSTTGTAAAQTGTGTGGIA